MLSLFLCLTSHFSLLSEWSLQNGREELDPTQGFICSSTGPSPESRGADSVCLTPLPRLLGRFSACDRNFVRTSVEPLGF